MRRSARILLSIALAAPLLPGSPARAQESPKPADGRPVGQATDIEARDALALFAEACAAEDPGRREDAVRRLRKVDHPAVAARILDVALQEGEVPVRTEAFRSLASQRCAVKTWQPKVAAWLAETAAGIRAARAKGDFGIRVDEKTLEPDLLSAEGKAAIRRKRDRSLLCLEAVRLLREGLPREKGTVATLAVFLADGNDDLVVVSLEILGAWKEWSVLPAVAELFRMYPDEETFETGTVDVDTGAAGDVDQNAAKRRYSAKYGDPDRTRGRPRVNAAVRKAALAISGKEFRTPAELRDFLARPEVRKRVKGG